MKFEIHRNPAGVESTYLASLNLAFGHWGDASQYAWVFDRVCGSIAPDQLILQNGDDVWAGSGVSYRKVRKADGRIVDVGIMTGSWTLPAARGQGCFGAIIDESYQWALERGASGLLAFVTHSNPSCRALERAGAEMVETSYWLSGSIHTPLPIASHQPPSDIHQALSQSRQASTAVYYPDLESLKGQVLERPLPTEVLKVGDAVCVIERAADTDRLLLSITNGEDPADVYSSLVMRAQTNGRKAFAFSVSPAPAGIEFIRGFLTVMTPTSGDLSQGWRIDSGDRM